MPDPREQKADNERCSHALRCLQNHMPMSRARTATLELPCLTRWTSLFTTCRALKQNYRILRAMFSLIDTKKGCDRTLRERIDKCSEIVSSDGFWGTLDSVFPLLECVSHAVNVVQAKSATLSDAYEAMNLIDKGILDLDLGPFEHRRKDIVGSWQHYRTFIEDDMLYLGRALDPYAKFVKEDDVSILYDRAMEATCVIPPPHGVDVEQFRMQLRSEAAAFIGNARIIPGLIKYVLATKDFLQTRHLRGLEWWKGFSNAVRGYDALVWAAQYVLSLPVTTARSERSWSITSDALPKSRNRLSDAKLTRILCIREYVAGEPARFDSLLERACKTAAAQHRRKRAPEDASGPKAKRQRDVGDKN